MSEAPASPRAPAPIPAVPWIALATFLLCLPFLGSLPLLDPDEAYYPATAQESMDTGHPLDLRLNGRPRWEKPPGQYALIQVSFAALGRTAFASRTVSAVEGALLVLLMGALVGRLCGERAGRLTALVLASTLAHTFYSRAAHPEMALSLGTATGTLLLACWVLEERPPLWLPLAAGGALGFAFLAKGPVCLVPPVLMILLGLPLLRREPRPSWKRALPGFGIAAVLAVALAAPWFLWMGARHGDAFWRTVLGQLGHLTEEEYARDNASPLFFVPVLVAGSLPWLGVLPQSLRKVRRDDPSRRGRLRTLMAATLLGTFVFFSISSAQRINYGLHFFPPLAVVVGLWLEDVEEEGRHRVLAPAIAVMLVFLLTLGVAPMVAPNGILRRPGFDDPVGFRASAALASPWLFVALGLVPWIRGRPHVVLGGFAWRLALVGVLWVTALLALLPGGWRDALAPTGAFADAVRLWSNDRAVPVAVYRKRLPSLSFGLQREVSWPHSEEDLGRFLDREGHLWLVIHERHLPLIDEGAFNVREESRGYFLLQRATPEPGGMR